MISAEEARQEYLEILRGDEVIMIPFRLGLHSFASGENNTINPSTLYAPTGIELSPTFARAWSASFLGGIIYLPDTYIGMIGQARIYRLLTGNHRSLVGPISTLLSVILSLLAEMPCIAHTTRGFARRLIGLNESRNSKHVPHSAALR